MPVNTHTHTHTKKNNKKESSSRWKTVGYWSGDLFHCIPLALFMFLLLVVAVVVVVAAATRGSVMYPVAFLFHFIIFFFSSSSSLAFIRQKNPACIALRLRAALQRTGNVKRMTSALDCFQLPDPNRHPALPNPPKSSPRPAPPLPPSPQI